MKKWLKIALASLLTCFSMFFVLSNSNARYAQSVDAGTSTVDVDISKDITYQTGHAWAGSNSTSVSLKTSIMRAAMDEPILLVPGDEVIFHQTSSKSYSFGYFLKQTASTSSDYYYVDSGWITPDASGTYSFTVSATQTLNATSSTVTVDYVYFCANFGLNQTIGFISSTQAAEAASLIEIKRNGTVNDYRSIPIYYYSDEYDTTNLPQSIRYGQDLKIAFDNSVQASEVSVNMSSNPLTLVEDSSDDSDLYTFDNSTSTLLIKNVTGLIEITIDLELYNITYVNIDSSGLTTQLRHAGSLDVDLSSQDIDLITATYTDNDGNEIDVNFNDGSGNTLNELTNAIHIESLDHDLTITNHVYVDEDELISFDDAMIWDWTDSSNTGVGQTIKKYDSSARACSDEAYVMNEDDSFTFYQNDDFYFAYWILQSKDTSAGYETYVVYEDSGFITGNYSSKTITYDECLAIEGIDTSSPIYIAFNVMKTSDTAFASGDADEASNYITHHIASTYRTAVKEVLPGDTYSIDPTGFEFKYIFLSFDGSTFTKKYESTYVVNTETITFTSSKVFAYANMNEQTDRVYAIMYWHDSGEAAISTSGKASIASAVTHTDSRRSLTYADTIEVGAVTGYQYQYMVWQVQGTGYVNLYKSDWLDHDTATTYYYSDFASICYLIDVEAPIFISFNSKYDDETNSYSELTRAELTVLESSLVVNEDITLATELTQLQSGDGLILKGNSTYEYQIVVVQTNEYGFYRAYVSNWLSMDDYTEVTYDDDYDGEKTESDAIYKINYDFILGCEGVDSSNSIYVAVCFRKADGSTLDDEDRATLDEMCSYVYTHRESTYTILEKDIFINE